MSDVSADTPSVIVCTWGKKGMISGMPAHDPGSRRGSGVTSALTSWLARPLTSFHLLLAVFGLLTLTGLIMVLSASTATSYATEGSSYVLFEKQLVYVSVGLVLFWTTLRLRPTTIRRLSAPAFLAALLLLVLVLTPLGIGAFGAHRWLSLGSFTFEPVEAAKLALALWGAHVLIVKRALLYQWRHLLVPVVPAGLVIFTLVMLQPDFGTTTTLAIILMALLWFVGAPVRLFGALVLGATTAAAGLAAIADYRFARISSFLQPNAAPASAGYQAQQARFALAEGGLVGKGLGQGAAKWGYLPNVHNDFIFAVIGEELGVLGGMVVLGLYAALAYVGLRIAARNTDPWRRLVAATLTVWLVSQAVINIGYVVGLLPVTGLPLPLVSSGGTSVIITMVVFGVLANFARHEPEAIAAFRTQGQGWLQRWLRLPMPMPERSARRRRPPKGPIPPQRTNRPPAAGQKAVRREYQRR